MPRAGPFPASTRTQGWRESRGRKLSLESCNQLGDGLLSSFVLFGFYFFCPGVGWQLWSSFGILDFFSLFVSGLRHYPKKKINYPKEHWNQSQIIWNAWPVQRKKRILNPNLSICLTHHRIAHQNVFFAKTNSDQVNARAKTRDQEDIDHSGPKIHFGKIKLHLTYFVVKLSK